MEMTALGRARTVYRVIDDYCWGCMSHISECMCESETPDLSEWEWDIDLDDYYDTEIPF